VTDYTNKFSLCYVKINAIKDRVRALGSGIDFGDIFEGKIGLLLDLDRLFGGHEVLHGITSLEVEAES
jgi:hypothetical protein